MWYDSLSFLSQLTFWKSLLPQSSELNRSWKSWLDFLDPEDGGSMLLRNVENCIIQRGVMCQETWNFDEILVGTWNFVSLNYTHFNTKSEIRRAFHNVLSDYKHLQQENQRTYLNGIFHSHRKSEKVFFFLQLEMFDVCTTGDTAHIDMIFKLLPHTRQHVDACVATTWIVCRVTHGAHIEHL